MFSSVAGQANSALVTLFTYIMCAAIPIALIVLGAINVRKPDPDSKRLATAMFGLAGLVAVVVVGYFLVLHVRG